MYLMFSIAFFSCLYFCMIALPFLPSFPSVTAFFFPTPFLQQLPEAANRPDSLDPNGATHRAVHRVLLANARLHDLQRVAVSRRCARRRVRLSSFRLPAPDFGRDYRPLRLRNPYYETCAVLLFASLFCVCGQQRLVQLGPFFPLKKTRRCGNFVAFLNFLYSLWNANALLGRDRGRDRCFFLNCWVFFAVFVPFLHVRWTWYFFSCPFFPLMVLMISEKCGIFWKL